MPDVKFSNQYPYTDFHELNLDWVIETVKHWSELVGKTIQSITLTGTTGLVDTYTINYSDGTTSTFTVTNGRGITSIALTGSLGLVDTYTITYNDGSTSTFQINNGNGISSIEKTGTSGLIDTYTITFTDGSSTTFEVKNGAEAIDATLTLPGYAADAAAVGAALALKQNAADPAGLAENLTPYSPDSGASQNQPFILQGTGTGNGESVVDTGSYAQIQNKNGNSAGVNQLFPDYPDSTNTIDGVTITAAGGYITLSGLASADIFNAYELQFTPVSGRKYLIMADARGTPAASGATWQWYLSGGGLGLDYEISRKIYTATDNSQVTMRLAVYNGVTIDIKSMMPRVIDLSLWFGSTANIPAHLLSHPEDFGRYYSGSLANNPGQLVNADGTVLKSTGRNVWDEQTELGRLDVTTGADVAATNRIRSVGYTPCSPNTEYNKYCASVYVSSMNIFWYDADKNFISFSSSGGNNNSAHYTSPTNARFFRFYMDINYGTSYKHDITISLYYSGESGYDQYYPYSVLAEVDTGSEVLYGDGTPEHSDSKLPDGTITHNRARATFDGTQGTWSVYNGAFYRTFSGYKKITGKAISNLFAFAGQNTGLSDLINNAGRGSFAFRKDNDTIQFYPADSSITTSAEFNTWLASHPVTVEYDLATPTTEQGTPFSGASADNFAIDDFGSMYWTQTNGVPQGVEIFYPYDYKAAVDTLLNMVSGDVDNLATDAELATVAGRVPIAPTANGTYVLKVTVTGGVPTYSWVAE